MVSLKAVWEIRIASRKKTATASRIMTRLRLEIFGGRVGTVCDTRISGPVAAGQSLRAGGEATESHYRCRRRRRTRLIAARDFQSSMRRRPSRRELFEHRAVGGLGLVGLIKGQRL